MDVGLGDVDVAEQGVADLALVGLRVADRHVALIAEEDVDAGPVDAGVGVLEFTDALQQADAGTPAGEHQAGHTVGVDTAPGGLEGGDDVDERRGGLVEQGGQGVRTTQRDH